MRSAWDLQCIAKAGGTVIIPEEASYSAWDLQCIAGATKDGGGQLIIKGCEKYSSWDLQCIAQNAPGRVIFED